MLLSYRVRVKTTVRGAEIKNLNLTELTGHFSGSFFPLSPLGLNTKRMFGRGKEKLTESMSDSAVFLSLKCVRK